jgi:hypothetical protein
MGYCSASDISSLTKNLLGSSGSFDSSTCPTVAQVNAWITSGCGVIESTLAGAKYSVPVASGTAAYDWLRNLNALYGAAWAEMSRTNVTLEPNQRTRGQVFLEEFWSQLEKLTKGDLTLAGLGRTSQGKLYVGGISISDKQLREGNTDRVPPKFHKGLGSFPGTIEPGATTAS